MKNTVVLLTIGLLQLTASADTQVITLMEGENFWGGCVTDGRAMPFGDDGLRAGSVRIDTRATRLSRC